MAEYVWAFYDGYRDLMDNKSDARVNGWFLMSSPFPTLGICLFYVYFVKVLGPRWMENRKPFDLRHVMIWYNFVQVIFSSWLFYEALAAGWWNDYSFRCQPIDYSDNPKALRMASGCWWYYFSKFTELLDTVFFVLRKKNDHVSTLHVIHHGCMPMSVWFGVKFTPGGHSSFFGLLNTFVHIVMYTYYFLAALGPKLQPYLWWKKYLTALQMVQFILVMIHAFQLFFIDCDYPRAFVWWIGMHAVMFYFLFRGFYNSTYRKNQQRKANALKAAAAACAPAASAEATTGDVSAEVDDSNADSSVDGECASGSAAATASGAAGTKERRRRRRDAAAQPLSKDQEETREREATADENTPEDAVIYANQYKMATGYISDSGLRNRVFIDNRTFK